MSVPPDADALRRMLAEARAHTERLPGGYPQAVADTLAWVLGEVSTAPLSGIRCPDGLPTEDQLRTEYDQAEHWTYRTAESSIPQYHVVGVESALMWVCGLTTIKPLEFIYTSPPDQDFPGPVETLG
jgi:hypothetical protein